MGNFRPLRTKCWKLFITSVHGYQYDRTVGDHEQYIKRGKRTIPVVVNKDTPAFHLRTGCRTLGIDIQELYKWADQNC